MKKSPKLDKGFWIYLTIALVCALLLVICGFYWKDESIWNLLVKTILSTLTTISGVELIWELISKKQFADYIVDEVHLSENIKNSGISKVYSSYKDINWRQEIEGSKYLFIFLAHGFSWLKDLKDGALKEFLKQNGTLEICLANPFNDALLNAYDLRFNYSHGTTKERIKGAIEILKEIGELTRKFKNIKLSFFNGMCVTSYFFIGKHSGNYNSCICTFYNHSRRSGIAPAVKIMNSKEESAIFNFLKDDLQDIKNGYTLQNKKFEDLLKEL